MNFRKNKTLIIGLGTSVVLLCLSLFFLVSNRSSFNESRDSLMSSKNRLVTLNNRNPFPSDVNVGKTEDQLSLIKTNYEAVTTMLQDGQLVAEKIEPAQFALILEEAVRRIRGRAVSDNIVLPAEPGLGFKDYAAGKLPSNDPSVIERLVIQIKALEDIVNLLISAKVNSIDTLQREQFEVAAAQTNPEAETNVRNMRSFGREPVADTRSTAGGIPAAATSDLYTTERFTVEFTARESAVWEALNRLAGSKVTYVLVDLSMNSTASGLGKPVDLKSKVAAQAATARSGMPGVSSASPSLESLSREERVVGGREPIKVRMVIDMYRFKDLVEAEVNQ